MKYKRLVAALAVISVCSTVLVGCGEKGKNEDKSEKNAESVLTFWDFHTGTEAEVIENMIDEYNASQDKVKVEYSSVNQTDYTTTLVTTAYANGECHSACGAA